MNKQDRILQRIEFYLEGQMTELERQAFEKDLQEDESLSKTWSLYNEVDVFIQDEESSKIESIIKDIGHHHKQDILQNEKELPSITKKQKGKTRFFTWLIISIFTLLIISYFTLVEVKKDSTSQEEFLFAEYYEPYPHSPIVRSSVDNHSNVIDEIINSYLQKDYSLSLTSIDRIIDSITNKEDKSALLFYRGLNQMELKKEDEAIISLHKVLAVSQNSFEQQSFWYLALLHLKQGNKTESKKYLNNVIQYSSKGKYSQSAKSLLKQLN